MIDQKPLQSLNFNSPPLAPACCARNRLSPKVIAALNIARAFAATYVVAHHLAYERGWSHGPGVVLRFGQEAVMIFFLLSGTVIFANERVRALRPFGYYLRRLRRIYPPLICAMIVSTLVALDNGDFLERFRWTEFLGTLSSLQDVSALKPGVIVDPYMGNSPLWSLSYEVAFYVAFPIVLMAWSRAPVAANHLIGAACCGAYASYVLIPNHWSLAAAYFLVWWTGAMAADAYLRGQDTFIAMRSCVAWLGALCAFAGSVVIIKGYAGLGLYPFLQFREFSASLFILIILFGPIGRSLMYRASTIARPAAFLASISYGIYVLHNPLMVQSRHSVTWPGLVMMGAILIIAAYIADRELSALLPRAPSD